MGKNGQKPGGGDDQSGQEIPKVAKICEIGTKVVKRQQKWLKAVTSSKRWPKLINVPKKMRNGNKKRPNFDKIWPMAINSSKQWANVGKVAKSSRKPAKSVQRLPKDKRCFQWPKWWNNDQLFCQCRSNFAYFQFPWHPCPCTTPPRLWVSFSEVPVFCQVILFFSFTTG